jgi:hypothetical protein
MSEVVICNLALSHLGDTATVMSIRPPDSSVQAQLCARFYDVARNALLEMANWGFATKRIQLAQVVLPTYTDSDGNAVTGSWQYGYAVPADIVNAAAVLPAEAMDDYEQHFGPWQSGTECLPSFPQGYVPIPGAVDYTPRPFSIESDQKGNSILLTNVSAAVLRYTGIVTDTTEFTPLFTLALSYLLASMLAGPIIKGDEGAAKAVAMMQMFGSFKGQASASDANQRKIHVEPAVSWIRGR